MKFHKSGTLRLLFAVICIIIVCALVYAFMPKILGGIGFLARIFMPFILGYVFSLIVNPLADMFQSRFRLPRGLSAILVLILTIGLVGGILSLGIVKFVGEIRNLYIRFPVIYENMRASVHDLSSKWAVVYVSLPENIQIALSGIMEDISQRAASFINVKSTPIVGYAGGLAKKIPGIFIGVIIFILSSFFMVSDADRVSDAVKRIIPHGMYQRLHKLQTEMQKYLGGYLKAQCIIMSVAFVIIFAGLSILQVDYALLIALGIAVFDALPFFGSGAILLPWAVISFVSSDIKTGVGLIIIYFAVICTRQFTEPKIVSSNIGTPPIATLMAMYTGYKIFSIGGMILGPIVMMLCISLYKAGVFDGLIRAVKAVIRFFAVEFKDLKNTVLGTETPDMTPAAEDIIQHGEEGENNG